MDFADCAGIITESRHSNRHESCRLKRTDPHISRTSQDRHGPMLSSAQVSGRLAVSFLFAHDSSKAVSEIYTYIYIHIQ